MLRDLGKLFQYIKGVKPYTLTFLLIALTLYLFRDNISHIVNTRLLNNDRVVNQLQGNLLVSSSLRRLMEETNSDRAYIFRFHNGDAYYNGTHKNKFSCDYEVVKTGVARQAQDLQNIPVTLYPEFIDDVIRNEMHHKDIDSMDNLVLKSVLKEQGIVSIAVAPYFRNGNLFAMIGVDYIRGTDSSKFDEYISKSINKFTKKAQSIGKLLK